MVGNALAVVASRTSSIVPASPVSSHARGEHKAPDQEDGVHDGIEESETETARIERLGRERPANFKSLWAEVAFCYSILASMLMAVSCAIPPFSALILLMRYSAGILRQWLQCVAAYPSRKARHTASVASMAVKRLHPSHRCLYVAIRSFGGYVWRLSIVPRWTRMELRMVPDRRLRPEPAHARLLSRAARSWNCCFSSHRSHVDG